jgi:hypothetical protein
MPASRARDAQSNQVTGAHQKAPIPGGWVKPTTWLETVTKSLTGFKASDWRNIF